MSQMRHTLRREKQRLVNEHGVGTDLPRTLVTFTGGQPIGAYSDDDDDAFFATGIVAIGLSDCDRAVFISEHYVEVASAQSRYSNLPGRFAAGDADVSEAFACTSVSRDGRVEVHWDLYHYDGKTVAWEDGGAHPVMSETLAEQATLLTTHGFDLQARRPGPAMMQPGTVLLGTRHRHGDQLIIAFALASPCSCGSRKPIIECCARNN
jgi:hypothetical protein